MPVIPSVYGQSTEDGCDKRIDIIETESAFPYQTGLCKK